MANAVKWATAVDRGTVMTDTELSALPAAGGAGNVSAVSPELDNGTNKDRWASFSIDIDYVSAPTAGGTIDLYLVPEIDLDSYPTMPTAADDPPQLAYLIGVATALNLATAQTWAFMSFTTGGLLIPIPPLAMKFVCVNNTDQVFPTTATTVINMTTYNEEIQ